MHLAGTSSGPPKPPRLSSSTSRLSLNPFEYDDDDDYAQTLPPTHSNAHATRDDDAMPHTTATASNTVIASTSSPSSSSSSSSGGGASVSSKREVRYTQLAVVPDYSIKCCNTDDSNACVRFLLSQRVYGYPGSNGSRWSNYWHFVRNNHPFLSIILCDRRNPYNSKQRTIVFFCVASLAILLSFVCLKTTLIRAVSVCNAGCNNSSRNTCQGGLNDGVSYLEYQKRCALYSPQTLSVAIGVVILPYGSLLRFFSICSCLQGRAIFQTSCFGERFKSYIEYFGGLLMSFFVLMSGVMILYVVISCWSAGARNDWNIFTAFALSKCYSSIQWFIVSGPFFVMRYPFDKSAFYRDLENERVARAPRQVIFNAATRQTMIRIKIEDKEAV